MATSADLDTGYPAIDAQHHGLEDPLGTLLRCVSGCDLPGAKAAFAALRTSTAAHFAWEEGQMAGFEGAVAHRADHAGFLAELDRIAGDLATRGISPATRLWVDGRFLNWFRFHGRSADAALAKHLRRRDEALAAAPAAVPAGAPDPGATAST